MRNQEEKLLEAEKKSRDTSWREAEIALEVEKHGYYLASTKRDAF